MILEGEFGKRKRESDAQMRVALLTAAYFVALVAFAGLAVVVLA